MGSFDETDRDELMKKIGPFFLGCIILLMAVQTYAVVYDPPFYATSLPLSQGERFFNGQTLSQVPEPGVLLLLGAGLIVLVILGIRKRKRTAAKGTNNP